MKKQGTTKSNLLSSCSQKKKLLSSIPFFLLVQFLHQNDALAPFHRTSLSLSLSLCNATMTSAFKNLPALLHHIEVWLSAYWEFHSMRCDLGA
jgi:hypothetical protein